MSGDADGYRRTQTGSLVARLADYAAEQSGVGLSFVVVVGQGYSDSGLELSMSARMSDGLTDEAKRTLWEFARVVDDAVRDAARILAADGVQEIVRDVQRPPVVAPKAKA